MTPKPSLAETIAEAERRAFAAGAILPLESEAIDADDGQFQFQATWLSSLSMKDMAAAIAASGPAAANPFLPPEPDLVVTDLSPTHMIILNKVPLEPGHVMAISREFRQQQSLLDVEDWQAIATVLAEIDVLVMFNGGKPAGASQDHRHIHFMPGRKASLEPLFLDLAVSPDPQRVPAFNFPHVLVRLDGAAAIEAGAEPAALAEELDVAFRRAAQGVRIVEELPRPTYHSVHFHPADFGGVLASVDQQISEPDLLAPYGDWLPAGDDWRMAMTPDVLDLAAVTISTPDPVALAGSWSRLLDRPQVGLRLALDQGEIRFALGQTTAITGIDLKVADRTRAGEPAVTIGGVAFSPV